MISLTRRSLLATAAAATLALAAVAVVLGGSSSPPAAAAPDGAEGSETVAVRGLGRVTGTPDVLRLNLGVEHTGSDVNDALNRANTDIDRIREVLERRGVAEEDIQTAALDISPNYTERGRVDGYRVSESLQVKLRDLEKAGATISEAARAGGDATRIQGVSFLLEDNTDLIEQARAAAFSDARAKAEQYADLAGRDLGAVMRIEENTGSDSGPPVPYAFGDKAAASGAAQAAPAPIEPGSEQVDVAVRVVWQLR